MKKKKHFLSAQIGQRLVIKLAHSDMHLKYSGFGDFFEARMKIVLLFRVTEHAQSMAVKS